MHKKEVVLITGMAGFIGYHLAKKMATAGHHILGFDNLNDYYSVQLKRDRLDDLGIEAEEFKGHEIHTSNTGSIQFFKGDLNDSLTWEILEKSFRVSSIVHLAAQAGVRYSLEKPEAYVESNVSGFLKVLEFCKRIELKKLVYASSSSVYGVDSEQPFSEDERCDKPVSLYAATKRSNEMMAHTYSHLFGIDSIGLRFFTVYGPWGRPDMAPFIFTKAALSNTPINVFNNGEQARDFTFVDDIVGGLYSVFQQQEKIQSAEICNIGNGAPVQLMDFIAAIEAATRKPLKKEFKPAQPGDVVVTYADTSKFTTKFGQTNKTPLKSGVVKFVDWYKTYHQVDVEMQK